MALHTPRAEQTATCTIRDRSFAVPGTVVRSYGRCLEFDRHDSFFQQQLLDEAERAIQARLWPPPLLALRSIQGAPFRAQ